MNLLRRPLASYNAKIISTAPLVYFPMDETSGLVAKNWGSLGAAANGTYTGVALRNQPGPKGGACPYYDGLNDNMNILTVPFNNAFNSELGSLLVWAKVDNALVWVDVVARHPIYLYNAQPTYIRIYKSGTSNNTLVWQYYFDPASIVATATTSTLLWFCAAMTWNKSTDTARFYFNGVVQGLGDYHGLGVFTPPFTTARFGSNDWKGWLAHGAVWDRELSAEEIKALA